ncbi:hypothetical protein K505DRAFT_392400 [Melanomma pulvis-pyrius CBS 109.77]|uniref:Uncharacterized protein n=1 Tax=Melanomma pulvis-pyrius CBS 109.77 TaxID=1314802 RepID=A0A6A6X064_9PLEO|nr:hypothetical protein K505DRAFT_392400 [Melanomma pulvis-pyrius CBS 109.77]
MGFLSRIQSRKRRSHRPSTTAPTPNSTSTAVADHRESPASTHSLRPTSNATLCRQSQSSSLHASSSVEDSGANILDTEPTQPSRKSSQRQRHEPDILQPRNFLGVPHSQLNAYVETLCIREAEILESRTRKGVFRRRLPQHQNPASV